MKMTKKFQIGFTKQMFAVAIVVGSTGWLAANAQSISADHLEERIQSSGAKGVVLDLTRNQAEWNQVLDHVASGDSAWLKVAERLRPATKAEATRTLDGAVAAAIQRNPDGVLELIGRVFRVSDVCREPAAEGSSEPQQLVLERTREALEGVTRPALATRRYECLQELPRTDDAMAAGMQSTR